MRVSKYLFFPISLVYLEIVFHIYINMNPDYILVILPFALSMGFLFAFFTGFFTKWIHRIAVNIVTGLMCIVFCVELICRAVLKQYYQLFSVMSTAADNRLTDYKDAVIQGILNNIFGILAFLLPFIFVIILGKKMKITGGDRRLSYTITTFILAVAFHITGIAAINGPWAGDFTPKTLYYTDTYVEDQVEQLGIITMLRLDVKHSILGIPYDKNTTFENTFTQIPQVDFATISEQTPQVEEVTVENEEAQSTATENIADVIDTSPNILNIDFDTLIANSSNDSVLWLNQYFQSQEPTAKNEYTGMFEGYNIIFITMEGFSKYLIDPERTPTLYKMANEGFVFENYYSPLHYTSTSGGEFQNLVGLYPKNGNPISMKETGVLGTNLYFSLANQLNQKGYYSIGFHNNQDMYGRSLSHCNLGYEWNQGGEGFDMEKNESGNNVWPQSDLYMMQNTVSRYIDQDYFNVYYITVSGHMPYNFTGDTMAVRNKEIVEGLDYTETTKAYIAANYEVEKAMTYLIEQLEAAGKAENTLIVMTPDHIPYFNVDTLEELSGSSFGGDNIQYLKESDVNFDLYRNCLIIWSASMKEPIKVSKLCSQVDILPTVSNLLGLDYDSRLLVGTDILSDSSPLVLFSSASWLTERGLYNRYSGIFTPAAGVTMTELETTEYVDYMKTIVRRKLQASVSIVEQDYYQIISDSQVKP